MEAEGGDAALLAALRRALTLHKSATVLVSLMGLDGENAMVLRAAAKAWSGLGRTTVLRVVLRVCGDGGHGRGGDQLETDDNEEEEEGSAGLSGEDDEDAATNWTARYANLLAAPKDRELADAVDIVVVDPARATAKLMELAACGHVAHRSTGGQGGRHAARARRRHRRAPARPPLQLQHPEPAAQRCNIIGTEVSG